MAIVVVPDRRATPDVVRLGSRAILAMAGPKQEQLRWKGLTAGSFGSSYSSATDADDGNHRRNRRPWLKKAKVG